jgi:hypothetical protein
MADKSVTATAEAGKGSDGGILGRQLVGDIESVQLFMDGLSDRLGFLRGGLEGRDPDIGGAVGFLSDLVESTYEWSQDLKDIAGKAKQLAEIAEGEAPILPNTTGEADLFEAIKRGRRDHFEADFICKAGLAAARIFHERFARRKLLPEPQDEADAVEEAASEMGEQEASHA